MNIQSAYTGLPKTVRHVGNVPASTASAVESPAKPGALANAFDVVMDAGYFTFNEIVEAGKNDPALALRYGATTLSEQLLTGVSENVRVGFAAAIIPTMRLSLLAANGYRLNKTLKDPTTHMAEKAFDIARVATDVIGLAGSVMKYAFPAKAALGDTLVGVSYAADSVSHSVRLMTHGVERVTVWKKRLEERKEAGKRRVDDGQPALTPSPPLSGPGAANALAAFSSKA